MLVEDRNSMRLADLLGTEHRKSDAEHGHEITADYLDYLCTYVQVTWECAREPRARYGRYELPKGPWQIHSEASIGKAHMEKMGLTPFRELIRWTDEVLATVIEAYYGGRAECAIRRIPVPGVVRGAPLGVDYATSVRVRGAPLLPPTGSRDSC
jgi:hypothetical protein